MDKVFPMHKKAINRICAEITHKEKETVIELLKKLGYYAEKLYFFKFIISN